MIDATNSNEQEKESLEIVGERPPAWLWDKIHQLFTVNDEQTVYTYGHKLHNPAGIRIDELLFEHEKEHEFQQMNYPGGPEAWWNKYFEDKAFREDQEFEAYHAQYHLFCTKTKSIDKRFKYRWSLAGQFCSMKDASVGRMDACNFLKYEIHA